MNWTDFRHAGNHVANETLDCAETCDVLAAALPYGEGDAVRPAFEEADVHVNVADILGKGASRARHRDQPRLDADLDALWDIQFFRLEHVAHLNRKSQ